MFDIALRDNGTGTFDIDLAGSSASGIKSVSGILWANINSVAGVAKASIKSVSGVLNSAWSDLRLRLNLFVRVVKYNHARETY